MAQKIYLLAFLTLWFVVVFILPSLRVKRKTGINPYVFKKSDSAHDYLGKVSPPITFLVFAVAIINVFVPSVLQYLAPFQWLQIAWLQIAGLVIVHIALIWIVAAQFQMSNSWRVGIDHSAKTELKTNGIFSVSRNPVFLGMIITLFGVFCILPNAITLLTVVASTLLFQVQVRLEEEYLLKTHGDIYSQYCKKTKRWI
jgi:protein-S-isoprenylcysteine O-methyltransferase Ste14